jgi:hypothetical protein
MSIWNVFNSLKSPITFDASRSGKQKPRNRSRTRDLIRGSVTPQVVPTSPLLSRPQRSRVSYNSPLAKATTKGQPDTNSLEKMGNQTSQGSPQMESSRATPSRLGFSTNQNPRVTHWNQRTGRVTSAQIEEFTSFLTHPLSNPFHK